MRMEQKNTEVITEFPDFDGNLKYSTSNAQQTPSRVSKTAIHHEPLRARAERKATLHSSDQWLPGPLAFPPSTVQGSPLKSRRGEGPLESCTQERVLPEGRDQSCIQTAGLSSSCPAGATEDRRGTVQPLSRRRPSCKGKVCGWVGGPVPGTR